MLTDPEATLVNWEPSTVTAVFVILHPEVAVADNVSGLGRV
jgi:hypothetical protein